MQHPPITLRYFDARGRAQFLRYYFRARRVTFTDERVALSADFAPWRAIRDDRVTHRARSTSCPCSCWGDRLIAETLMIASFVHEVSGDASALSDDDNLRHGMLTSSLCQDVMTPIAHAAVGGDDVSGRRPRRRREAHVRAARAAHPRARSVARRMALARQSARNRRVMLADCLLWEELNVAQHVFGPRLSLAQTPMLARFYEEFPARPSCESAAHRAPLPHHGTARGGRRHREDPAAARLKAGALSVERAARDRSPRAPR